MKWIVAAMLVSCTGCEAVQVDAFRSRPTAERPTVNVPVALRQANWTSNGSGSCVHATMISLLRWQGRFRMGGRAGLLPCGPTSAVTILFL
jgi:hypothetical protein